jgi:fucose 4-O-acetylase-like acetyltransferase
MHQPRQARAVLALPPAALAGIAAAVCWAWFASGVRTFTRPAELLTFVPALLVLLMTLRPAGGAPVVSAESSPRKAWWTVLPWIAAFAALLAWELSELFSQPRQQHPTLSSITNALLSTHPTRFLGFLAWLLLGWLLVRDLGGARE